MPVLGLLVLLLFCLCAAVGIMCLKAAILRRKCTHSLTAKSVGFVHPNAYGGGGGERVLWVALQAMQEADIEASVERRYVVYCGEMPEKAKEENQGSCFKPSVQVLAEKQFGVRLRRRVEIAELKPWSVRAQDPSLYPRLTLVLQSLVGGVLLGLDVCLRLGVCDVMVDSVGVAFAYPLYRFIGRCHVAAYVHYPTISTDMIGRVATGKNTYNNDKLVAGNPLLTRLKLLYYRAFAVVYRMMGRCADVVMTNSTWTHNHIASLWNCRCPIVYPPVNVAVMSQFELSDRLPHIVSIGQFRPEKNHLLQIESFAKALPQLPRETKLYLVGGARNAEDKARVAQLKEEIEKRNLTDRVLLEVSVPFSRIIELLQQCAVGLHTMLDEHFGIVVVEYLASGCVALAHNSGGVKADIVDPLENGLLASNAQEFADGMVSLLNLFTKAGSTLLPLPFAEMQQKGRGKAEKFSDSHFGKSFLEQLSAVL